MQPLHFPGRLGVVAGLLWALSGAPASAQIVDLNTGRVPTLAPLVREVTPAVVNISVQGRVREDNPLYQDPLFREFFNVPKQLEKEVNATGSGVIVDAQRGYVLTANHVVANAAAVQIRTKDGRKFKLKLPGLTQRPDPQATEERGSAEPPRDDPRPPINPNHAGL